MRVSTTAGVCLFLAVGGNACGTEAEVDCETYKFSAREWRAGEEKLYRGEGEGEVNEVALKARRRAADALVKCRLVHGKTRAQVLKVLGNPYIHLREENAWAYRVGPERSPFSVDGEDLTIFFRGNRVVEVTVGVG